MVLMTLEEATKIWETVKRARSMKMKSGLPHELVLLSAYTLDLKEHTGRNELLRSDIEKAFHKYDKIAKETGDFRAWGKKINCQKILENWKDVKDEEEL